MPQAPADLQLKWGTDGNALAQLDGRYLVGRGGIIQPLVGTIPTEEDYSAIDYLIMEWDYGYNEIPVYSREAGAGRLEAGSGEAAPGGKWTGAVADEGPPAGFGAFDPAPHLNPDPYRRPLNLVLLASVSVRIFLLLVGLGLFGACIATISGARTPWIAVTASLTVGLWLVLLDGIGFLRVLWRDLYDVLWWG